MSSINTSYISPLKPMNYSEIEELDKEELQSESAAFFVYLQQHPSFKLEEPISHCPDPACLSRKRKQWSISQFEQHVESNIVGKLLKNARHRAIFKLIESVKDVSREKFLSHHFFSTMLVYVWPPTAIVYFYEPDLSLITSPIVRKYLNENNFGPGNAQEVWDKKKKGRTGFHLVDFTGDMIGLHNALLMTQSLKDDFCGRESFLWRYNETDGKLRGKMYGWIATVADTTDLPKPVTEKLMHKKLRLTTTADAQKISCDKEVGCSSGSSSDSSIRS